jgi:hypothetical protein
MTLSDAMEIAQSGFDAWAAKPHNRKWVRKIDGTPIPNDLVLCIASAFAGIPTKSDTVDDSDNWDWDNF